jgi:hypothetical protein
MVIRTYSYLIYARKNNENHFISYYHVANNTTIEISHMN